MVAGISTFITLLIGYPMAYAIARATPTVRNLLLMAVMLPFWSSFLLRVYALKTLMADTGLVNALLLGIGVIDTPIRMLQTDFALYVGISYTYLPFMILPLYATLERLDWSLVEAAEDLGCRPWKAFLLVTLPLSVPGIIAGAMLVFIPATGEFVIPNLLGASDTLMVGRMLWDTFFNERDWTLASALAVVLLLLLVVPIMLFQVVENRRQGAEA
jgi:putrescine transport system permease protein